LTNLSILLIKTTIMDERDIDAEEIIGEIAIPKP
jgi:hypothetical protein